MFEPPIELEPPIEEEEEDEVEKKEKKEDVNYSGNDIIETTKNTEATEKPVIKEKTQKPKIADQTAVNQTGSARNKHSSFLVSMAATVFALFPVIAVR